MTPDNEKELLDEVSDIRHMVGIINERVANMDACICNMRESDLRQWHQIERQAILLASHTETLSMTKKMGLIVMGASMTAVVSSTLGVIAWIVQRVL